MKSIYIIKASSDNQTKQKNKDKKDFYKIGLSFDPDKRKIELDTGCPLTLEVVDHFECVEHYLLENIAHKMFAEHKVKGEWFSFTNTDLKKCIAFIKNLADKLNIQIKYDTDLKNIKDVMIKQNEQCDFLCNELEKLNSLIHDTHTTKISISNYFQKHYPDAQSLRKLKEGSITATDVGKNLMNIVINEHENSMFYKYLGDRIVKYYKTDDPMKQSLWVLNIPTFKYVIKKDFNDGKSLWCYDYGGNETKNYIIVPFLQYIMDAFNAYYVNKCNMDLNNEILSENESQNETGKIKENNYGIAFGSMIYLIQKGKLLDNIFQYITPFFVPEKEMLAMLDDS